MCSRYLVDKEVIFIILVGMQLSLAILSKKAVEYALNNDWKKAIETNLLILDKYPSNTDTKIRLGRAYIQTKQFEKAKKIFKEVLEIDPINHVALKNLELAKNKKTTSKNENNLSTNSLVKEPGTTTELTCLISTKGITGRDFVVGEVLKFKVKKKSVEVLRTKNGKDIAVAVIEDKDIIKRMNRAEELSSLLTGYVTKAEDKNLSIIIRCGHPVFKGEKQDIRPYIKKGLDDIDLEESEEEETEEEIIEE